MTDQNSIRVLILHPDLKCLGGIERYIEKLRPRLTTPARSFLVGRRANEPRGMAPFRLVWDYARYLVILLFCGITHVHANPSLDSKSLYREGLFIWLAHRLGKKTLVFIHGWQKPFERELDTKGVALFRRLYHGTGAFIVLAKAFKSKMEGWGFEQRIHLEVTIMSDEVMEGFNLSETVSVRLHTPEKKALFLSRIFREKGVFEAVESIKILQKKFPDIGLVVAGDGPDLEAVKRHVEERGIPGITFTGFIKGGAVTALLKQAYLMCFPTYHGEGLPNAIVEAMAFGLPVVTRPVGGIADFFESGVHGFVTESKDPEDFAGPMKQLLKDENLYRQIAENNSAYARDHFLASGAAVRMDNRYDSL